MTTIIDIATVSIVTKAQIVSHLMGRCFRSVRITHGSHPGRLIASVVIRAAEYSDIGNTSRTSVRTRIAIFIGSLRDEQPTDRVLVSCVIIGVIGDLRGDIHIKWGVILCHPLPYAANCRLLAIAEGGVV